MNKAAIIEKTRTFVQETLAAEPTGHDWWHIYRVTEMALRIADKEGGDLFKIELISLLHDIADYKLYQNEQEGVDKLQHFLDVTITDNQLKSELIKDIQAISYKGALVEAEELSKEGQIVQDADRIDAIGAIGIARAFAYGGNKNRSMHNPEEAPEEHTSFVAYKNSKGTTINHFYEKLLLLKDRLNTKTAQEIAIQRHTFMQDFLTQFYKEWNVEV